MPTDFPRDLTDNKARLRKRMRAMRLVVDQKIGPIAAQGLIAMGLEPLAQRVPPGSVIAGYWPIITEIDIRPLLAKFMARGYPCALPVLLPGATTLLFRSWHISEPLEEGPLGTQHPRESAATVVPDLLLVPSLALDAHGHRLGQGHGWYDRTLVALRKTHPGMIAVGVCYDVQRLDQVPAGDDDAPVDHILTEQFCKPAERSADHDSSV